MFLHLSPREARLVRNLATACSERLARELHQNAELTERGRDQYLADLEDVAGLLRKLAIGERVAA